MHAAVPGLDQRLASEHRAFVVSRSQAARSRPPELRQVTAGAIPLAASSDRANARSPAAAAPRSAGRGSVRHRTQALPSASSTQAVGHPCRRANRAINEARRLGGGTSPLLRIRHGARLPLRPGHRPLGIERPSSLLPPPPCHRDVGSRGLPSERCQCRTSSLDVLQHVDKHRGNTALTAKIGLPCFVRMTRWFHREAGLFRPTGTHRNTPLPGGRSKLARSPSTSPSQSA
jgi:hypothetical protein